MKPLTPAQMIDYLIAHHRGTIDGEIVSYIKSAAADLEQARKWEAFGRALFHGWPESYGIGLDGFGMQELGEKHGVLVGTEQAGPCGEGCNCEYEYGPEEFPLTCYRVLPTGDSDDG